MSRSDVGDHPLRREAGRADPIATSALCNEPNEELAWLAGHASEESIQKMAFDELFRRLWRGSVEWARSAGARTQDEAEDAATQAWVQAWRYRHRYDRAQSRYGTWLGKIVRNETVDVVKRESRHRVATPPDADDSDRSDPSTEDGTNLVALSYVWEAFDALRKSKPEFASVLSLKAQGYQDKQICEKLGIGKPGTVASRLFRAKTFMAEWLAARGVLFLPEGTLGRVHPWGLKPLCRTGVGTFYSFSPTDGLFVLPTSAGSPPGATHVCDGFFVQVWSYPLQRFRIVSPPKDLADRSDVIFEWNKWAVVKLEDRPAAATG
ncbi:MAG: sigma-70 family RNA polymerase sigma factor [Actinomycetota bacterium]|nr:sigma-70 family RNA polymerase sigma factor [Actinomycetota bacterium]